MKRLLVICTALLVASLLVMDTVRSFAAESFFESPSIGKKERSQTQTVDGETVHQKAGLLCSPTTTYCVSVTTAGSAPVVVDGMATATITRVTTSTTPTTLVSSNASRKGLIIYNQAVGNLFIKMGSGATTTSFTTMVTGTSGYSQYEHGYTGRIDGFLSTGTGTAHITELTQ